MKISYKNADVTKIKTNAVIIGLFSDLDKKKTWVSGAAAVIDKALDGIISSMIESKELTGKSEQVKVIPTYGKISAEKVIIVGLGKKDELTGSVCRNAAAAAVKAAKRAKCNEVASIVHGAGAGGLDPALAVQCLVEGAVLGSYEFKGLKSKADEDNGTELGHLAIIDTDDKKLVQFKHGAEKGRIIAEAQNLARELVALPGNVVTPTYLGKKAKELAAKVSTLKVSVLSGPEIKKLKMDSFLSVAKGSHEPCKLIVLRYNGGTASQKPISLVGKGITFDSGGISIKPSAKMKEMKGDMAGAAAVLCAMKAIAQLKLKKNVIGIIPATENMPGGSAIKPGDVVTASNGKTIEYISTDAEGRMILADALVYAQKLGAKKIVDAATLTGACVVALGELYAGILGNSQDWVDMVVGSAKKVGERLWQLPLDKEYEEMLKSDVADMKNANEDRIAGTIHGGVFLKEFIEDGVDWAHLDIAGTADIHGKIDWCDKGATGFGVRTFVELVSSL